jgi:carboxyl-terminal processing protease
MNERRFAEAEIVAGKAAELAPETPIAVAMVAKSRTAGRQEQGGAESGLDDPNPSQPTITRQRSVESPKRPVSGSTLDDTPDAKSASVSASLDEVLNRIERRYYGRLDRHELERAAIEAIMSKLDDKSKLLTREELKQMMISMDGNLVGVGIAIHLDSDTKLPVVTRPIRNSPGLAAGLRRDDVILSIDGNSTKGLSLIELVGKIRGRRGSTVTLEIQRADEKLEVSVVRQRFETSVINPWAISTDGREDYWADRDGKLGYIHILAFTKRTVSQLHKVLGDLSDEGLNGLVIDLRNCGGGLLTAAVELVDMFIDEGIILSSEGRSKTENVTFRAKDGGAYIDLPLVVLMNGATASAAEIVAASLQDHHRAALVGEQTFGKVTVQSLFRLPDGSALRLTTAVWLRSNGKTLVRREGRDDWGVQPDAGLTVVLTEEVAKQLAQQRDERLNRVNIDTPVDDTQLNKAVAFLQAEVKQPK